jgi:signal transduction histidine kinase
MNKLIDGVLQYSRISRTKVQRENVDLNEIIEYVWALLKPNESYQLIIKKELPTIHISYDKIQDVFLKVIENAIRFNDKTERLVSIDWSESQDFLNIMVEDNGIGIVEKEQQEIFKIFRTLDKKVFPNQIGLGLTLAKRIIEHYGGDIHVSSTPAIGTTFTLSIPKQDL